MQIFWECINSLAPGRCANIFNYVGFKHNVVSDIKNSFSEIAHSYFQRASLMMSQHWFRLWFGGTIEIKLRVNWNSHHTGSLNYFYHTPCLTGTFNKPYGVSKFTVNQIFYLVWINKMGSRRRISTLFRSRFHLQHVLKGQIYGYTT